MTAKEALDLLRRGATRQHGVLWELTGGGAGEPGGNPVITKACSCVRHSLTTARGVDDSLPCSCGAREWNSKVEEAINTLQSTLTRVVELFDQAIETPCRCHQPFSDHCKHCGLVIQARELALGAVFQNPDGN